MKKILIFIFFIFTFSVNADEKKTTFNEELFNKAQSEGKVVIVSSWVKYCSSCAGQMKILNKAKNEFDNIEYFAFDVTNKEISNFLNTHYAGKSLIKIRAELVNSMKGDRLQMNQLMQRTLDVADQIFEPEDNGDFVVAGQENLLDVDQTERLQDLRGLFKAFSLKGDILHVLDRCMESDGIKLFIGQESGYELLGDCSLVTSPYQVAGECVGVLGVIGPTRMAYDRIIPIVDATARMLTAAMDSSRR